MRSDVSVSRIRGREDVGPPGEPKAVVAPARDEVEVLVDAALAVDQQRTGHLQDLSVVGSVHLHAADHPKRARRWDLRVGDAGVHPVDPSAHVCLGVPQPEGGAVDLVGSGLGGLADRIV